ncbi:hypothetical protein MMC30_007333 [Trapelia coarctata]|nr:hypothetical protein [Trapelia coarctata]
MSDFDEQAWQGFFSDEAGEEHSFENLHGNPEAWNFAEAEGTDLWYSAEATEPSESSSLPPFDETLQLDGTQKPVHSNDIFQTLMEETSLIPLVQAIEAELADTVR